MNPTLLHDLLDDRAARTPEAAALHRHDRAWSYRDVAERSSAAAGWLHDLGVRRGDRVVLLARNDAEVAPLIFGISRLGAVFVLLSDQLRPFHLEHILADCAPRVVLGSAAALQRARPLVQATLRRFDEVPSTGAAPGTAAPCLSVDPVCLIYTSGSTALPKAVVSTHRQVLFAVDAIGQRLGYRSDDVVFCCLPLSFDYGLYQLFLATAAGARLALGDDDDAGPALLRRLAATGATVVPLVPSLAAVLCRLLDRAGHAPPALRMVTNTGAELTTSTAARLRAHLPALDVVAMFGLTECKRISIAEPNLDLRRPGSVGRPLPDTEAYVVDDEGRPVPPGTIGELVVRGAHVMAGYWNRPELTAQRFRRDALGQPVLHTGDRCRADADGYLYFVGRDDDVYKQRGFRVSTTEIEAAAMDVPGVEFAAALPPDDRHGARLAVRGDITADRLVKELLDRIEEQKIPAECRVLETLPLGVNGKIDRRALAAGWDDTDGAAR
ncbi:class I adenylate-forming enzyme family protein [Micromonospora sp. KLBMP9576]|uniref:class I adenylate-forming enzyme family protein n=1 Tax=Micromonospora sp. KLBMP9576 TaxID=3424769 RepID=UPI003D902BA5